MTRGRHAWQIRDTKNKGYKKRRSKRAYKSRVDKSASRVKMVRKVRQENGDEL